MFRPYIYSQQHINDSNLNKLLKLLDVDNNNSFKESHVYNRIKKENVVNKHLRSSEKIEYRDKEIFNWIETHIVNPLNNLIVENNDDSHFILVRNDIEVVKYEPGDFFNKHQDYINFDSNEFKNYTFIMCLKACQEGGETILHIDDEAIEFSGTAKEPGTMLLFQKDIIHEGRIVNNGSKYIMKGNLLCFQKNKTNKLLIVNLLKSPGKSYIIPYENLKKAPKSVYYAYYNFQQTNNSEQNVFYYDDDKMDDLTFKMFYDRIIPPKMDINDILEKMDYIGFNFDNIIQNYNKFINSDHLHGDAFYCKMNDYYQLLSLKRNKNIVPFQMISACTEGQEIILWFGLYDNIFATCDYFCGSLSINDKYYESSDDDSSDSDDDDNSKKRINNYIGKKLFIKDSKVFLPHKKWINIINNYSNDGYETIRKHIWNNYRLKNINHVTNISTNNKSDQLHEYAMKMINGISSIQNGSKNDDGQYHYNNNLNHNLVKEKIITNLNLDIPTCEINYDLIDKLKINDMINIIKSNKTISGLQKTNLSESFCNETYYVTFDIVYRFGFMYIDEEVLNDSYNDPDSESDNGSNKIQNKINTNILYPSNEFDYVSSDTTNTESESNDSSDDE
jgi:hypothetical protein